MIEIQTRNESVETKDVETAPQRPVFAPRYSSRRVDQGVELDVELPGVTSEGLDLSTEGRLLTLVGRSHRYEGSEGLRPVRREFETGDYELQLRLPGSIDTASIEAQLTNGLLRLTLPYVKPERKQIDITTR